MQTMLRQIEPSDTPCSVDLIEPSYVPKVWPYAEPLLRPAIGRTGGRLSSETVYSWLCAGRFQLWMVRPTPTALVTEIRTFPTGLMVFTVLLLGGSDYRDWLWLWPKLEEWAAERGCTKADMAGRKGWLRVLKDWKATTCDMEKDFFDV